MPGPVDPVMSREFEDTADGLTTEDYRNFALVEDYQLARGSRKSYDHQWKRWREWADGRNMESLPANPIHVKAYLLERMVKHGHNPPP